MIVHCIWNSLCSIAWSAQDLLLAVNLWCYFSFLIAYYDVSRFYFQLLSYIHQFECHNLHGSFYISSDNRISCVILVHANVNCPEFVDRYILISICLYTFQFTVTHCYWIVSLPYAVDFKITVLCIIRESGVHFVGDSDFNEWTDKW